MTQFLLVICGIPASGKTSLAEVLQSHLEKVSEVRIVSTDEWRDEEYHSEFRPEKERAVRERSLETTAQLIEKGISVINDDTNYYQSMRHELYEIARRAECVFGVVFVNVPLDTAINWNRAREFPVPEEVIRRIHDRLDIPGMKYSWDSPIHVVDLTLLTAEIAASEIAERLMELNPLSEERPKSDDAAHNRLLDVVTRQTVSRFLDSCPEIRNFPEVSYVRKEVLRCAKQQGLTALETERELMQRLKEITIKRS